MADHGESFVVRRHTMRMRSRSGRRLTPSWTGDKVTLPGREESEGSKARFPELGVEAASGELSTQSGLEGPREERS